MEIPYYQVIAFAKTSGGGNFAGVCFFDKWPADTVMHRIARKAGLSETAFVVSGNNERSVTIRWFSPRSEVELCGHATLAAGHVLQRTGRARFPITCQSRAGRHHICERRLGGESLVEITLPALPPEPAGNDRAAGAALGRKPMALYAHGSRLLAVFATAGEVESLDPDMTRLSALRWDSVTVTAPGPSRDGSDCDIVSRFFMPRYGVPEGDVTGSAHAMAVPYWFARTGRENIHALQVSPRGGELFCRYAGGPDVAIAGRCRIEKTQHLRVDGSDIAFPR